MKRLAGIVIGFYVLSGLSGQIHFSPFTFGIDSTITGIHITTSDGKEYQLQVNGLEYQAFSMNDTQVSSQDIAARYDEYLTIDSFGKPLSYSATYVTVNTGGPLPIAPREFRNAFAITYTYTQDGKLQTEQVSRNDQQWTLHYYYNNKQELDSILLYEVDIRTLTEPANKSFIDSMMNLIPQSAQPRVVNQITTDPFHVSKTIYDTTRKKVVYKHGFRKTQLTYWHEDMLLAHEVQKRNITNQLVRKKSWDANELEKHSYKYGYRKKKLVRITHEIETRTQSLGEPKPDNFPPMVINKFYSIPDIKLVYFYPMATVCRNPVQAFFNCIYFSEAKLSYDSSGRLTDIRYVQNGNNKHILISYY